MVWIGVTVGFESGASAVTIIGADVPLQPLLSDPVTVYEPDELTVIAWVVAPFDQRYAGAALAVRVTPPPSQNVVGPLAVIVGVVMMPSCTTTALLVALQPAAFVTVTV